MLEAPDSIIIIHQYQLVSKYVAIAWQQPYVRSSIRTINEIIYSPISGTPRHVLLMGLHHYLRFV